MRIANAGNRHLNTDFDQLENGHWNDLVQAKAALRDLAATERLFDRRLLRIAFPPETERVARHLYRINQIRASLTTAAAQTTSLPRLHGYELLLNYKTGQVENAVRTLRRQLGLPPPTAS